MLYNQSNGFLRYDVAPISSYMHYYEPNDLKYRERTLSDGSVRLCITHNHIAVEVLIVTEGGITVCLNDRTYALEVNDVLFMNPFDVHTVIADKDCKRAAFHVINFDVSMLKTGRHAALDAHLDAIEQSRLKFSHLIPRDAEGAPRLRAVMREIHESYPMRHTPCGMLRITAGLNHLLATVGDIAHTRSYEESRLSKRAVFSMNAVQYVTSSYALPITTEQAAHALHFNTSYFCRAFKTVFGMTFNEYLNRYRITVAKGLSAEGNRSINEIAAAVGYANYNVFANHFKRFTGVSPRAYYK